MARRRAFTLVELVITLGIVAVLTAIALPRIARTDERTRLKAATDRVCRELRRAREWAACTGRSVTLTVNTERGVMTISNVQSERPDGLRRLVLADVPYRVSFSDADLGGDSVLVYNGLGSPDSKAELNLCTEHYESTITVDGTLGLATASPLALRGRGASPDLGVVELELAP